MALNTQTVALSTSVAYNFNGTTYSLPNSNARDIQSINLSMNSRITLAKFLRTMVNVSKTFNSGYAVDATNPLLINAGIETSFLKRKMANISLQANDILNQGNVVSRMVNNNSIIDSSTNRVTRYVVLNISMRLQKFGGGRPMI